MRVVSASMSERRCEGEREHLHANMNGNVLLCSRSRLRASEARAGRG